MGEHGIRKANDDAEARDFTRAVLNDIRALDALIARGGIETGTARMGAEQEMYLVGPDCRPRPCAEEILAGLSDDRFTTELARFNLEANLAPRVIGGDFLQALEEDLTEALGTVSAVAGQFDARVLLTGILPTLSAEDLAARNLTPDLRYRHLNDALFRGRDSISVVIDGIDHYEGSYDSVILESANTSLQLHLQVEPETSARLYNLMQLVTAPLLAAAANSPVLLGRRLWHETRVAVFERALDERTGSQLARGFPTRVTFGDDWVRDTVVDLFRDNAARYPVILVQEIEEDSTAAVSAGTAPALTALALHNGTVWRWNRPCYGVADGVAHLRIENRVLPAGPTIVDEVANAALFYGMMTALPETYGDVAARLPFADAKTNFLTAARQGLDAEFRWLDGRQTGARSLLLDELLPAARQGLASVNVPQAQIDRYLGTIEHRVSSGQTGAAWLLNTFQAHRGRPHHAVWRDAVTAMADRQGSGQPVHEWPLAPARDDDRTAEPTVDAIMTRDLFTLRPDDVVDLAVSVMEWKHIRHIPVETEAGTLCGVLTARDLLRAAQPGSAETDSGAVKTLMREDFITTAPETSLRTALTQMLTSDLGCLMVVAEGKLTGIVTERDLLRATNDLLTEEQS